MDERIAINLGILVCERDRRHYAALAAAHGRALTPSAWLAAERWMMAVRNVAAMKALALERGVETYLHP